LIQKSCKLILPVLKKRKSITIATNHHHQSPPPISVTEFAKRTRPGHGPTCNPRLSSGTEASSKQVSRLCAVPYNPKRGITSSTRDEATDIAAPTMYEVGCRNPLLTRQPAGLYLGDPISGPFSGFTSGFRPARRYVCQRHIVLYY
jgi:hypothetical protein